MAQNRRKRPLEVGLRDGVLSITIGVDTFRTAIEFAPDLEVYDEEEDDFARPKIVDADAFAKDLLAELEREEEDGTTMVHRMLDRAAAEAMENGCFGIQEPGEGEIGEQ